MGGSRLSGATGAYVYTIHVCFVDVITPNYEYTNFNTSWSRAGPFILCNDLQIIEIGSKAWEGELLWFPKMFNNSAQYSGLKTTTSLPTSENVSER